MTKLLKKTIPLSALEDDGALNFKVTASPFTTFITDYMPDVGSPPGVAEACLVSPPVDVKPGEGIKTINLRSNGVIPVAILGAADFDVMTIDGQSLAFGPDGASIAHKKVHYEDVNTDGIMDLLAHFRTQETGIASGDTEVCLKLLAEELLPEVNLFGYGQVASPYGSGQFIKDLHESFSEADNLILREIPNREGIMDSIRDFLGKGK